MQLGEWMNGCPLLKFAYCLAVLLNLAVRVLPIRPSLISHVLIGPHGVFGGDAIFVLATSQSGQL